MWLSAGGRAASDPRAHRSIRRASSLLDLSAMTTRPPAFDLVYRSHVIDALRRRAGTIRARADASTGGTAQALRRVAAGLDRLANKLEAAGGSR